MFGIGVYGSTTHTLSSSGHTAVFHRGVPLSQDVGGPASASSVCMYGGVWLTGASYLPYLLRSDAASSDGGSHGDTPKARGSSPDTGDDNDTRNRGIVAARRRELMQRISAQQEPLRGRQRRCAEDTERSRMRPLRWTAVAATDAEVSAEVAAEVSAGRQLEEAQASLQQPETAVPAATGMPTGAPAEVYAGEEVQQAQMLLRQVQITLQQMQRILQQQQWIAAPSAAEVPPLARTVRRRERVDGLGRLSAIQSHRDFAALSINRNRSAPAAPGRQLPQRTSPRAHPSRRRTVANIQISAGFPARTSLIKSRDAPRRNVPRYQAPTLSSRARNELRPETGRSSPQANVELLGGVDPTDGIGWLS